MKRNEVTLFDRALGDLKIVKINLSHAANDPIIMDICAYHCQQCIKKLGWGAVIRYANAYKSNKEIVDKVLCVCEQLVELVRKKIPDNKLINNGLKF